MTVATTSPQTVLLYTDGACIGNPGPGGWAYILKLPHQPVPIENSGGESRTTNNRMELMAVIAGLEALETASVVKLIGDSQYVLLGLSQWMPGWKKRGWIKQDKRPVLNTDLWQKIDELTQKHRVTVEWTRGHIGHPENERCDFLAGQEAKKHAKNRL